MQNCAIFVQRMEFLLKSHLQNWWRGEITDCKNPNIVQKQIHHFPIFTFMIIAQQFFYSGTILAEWLGNRNFWSSLLMHTGLKRNKIIFVFCSPELYTLTRFPDYILSNFKQIWMTTIFYFIKKEKEMFLNDGYSDYSVLLHKQVPQIIGGN